MLEPNKQALHKAYHDHLYGFPIVDDNALFERMVLEINQAGLSWETILKKAQHFKLAYSGFNIQSVAQYTDADRARLLHNPRIIRNRLKINAAIENAQRLLQIQKDYGSFHNWLVQHHPLTKAEWVKLFKKQFLFMGGEIVGEFLMSIGVLPGAHDLDCPIYNQIKQLNPMWMRNA
jgi:DNA-3-methyladenine glycosylase I